MAKTWEIRDIKRMAANPQNKRQWFIRRIWLDGTWEDFLALRRQLASTGKPYTKTFWDAACSPFFGFNSVEDEKKRCKLLESMDDHKRRQRKVLMDEEKKADAYEYDEKTPYYDSVKWAFENWSKFVKICSDGGNQLKNVHKMRTEAPSLGAVGLIEYARQSLDKFQALASRVLARGNQPDQNDSEGQDKIVDKGVDNLKEILSSLGHDDQEA